MRTVRVAAPLLLAAFSLFGQISFQAQGPELSPPPSNTPADQKCVVEGRVTNSQTGEPVKKAAIRLIQHGRTTSQTFSDRLMMGQQGYSATSLADGTFHIDGIEPGEYLLSGMRTGYLNTAYGAKSPSLPGKVLSLQAGQQTTDIVLALIPQAVISGRVLDEDGDPVQGAMVQVLAATWQRGKLRYMPHGGNASDDRGEYRTPNLSPGKYYVCAQKPEPPGPNPATASPGKPDIRPIRTCYPQAIAFENSTPVEVHAGQDASGIDIRLQMGQTYHVRGRVFGVLPDAQHVSVTLTQKDEPMLFLGGQTTVNKDQTFDLPGIAPGSYIATAFVMGAGPIHSVGRQPIEVGQGDVNDVAVPLLQAGTVHGHVRIEGTPVAGSSPLNFSDIRVHVVPAENSPMFGPTPFAPVKSDGTFTWENVTPAKYHLVLLNAPGAYLKSVRFGQQEIQGNELDLSQSASGDLELVFRYGPAELDGVLQAADDTSSNGGPSANTRSGSLVLVPEGSADSVDWQFATASQSGTFTMKPLRPGRYRIYAFEQVDMAQLQNPEVLKALENRGTDVELNENEKKQIQLTPISADELQQVFAKLGIDSTQ